MFYLIRIKNEGFLSRNKVGCSAYWAIFVFYFSMSYSSLPYYWKQSYFSPSLSFCYYKLSISIALDCAAGSNLNFQILSASEKLFHKTLHFLFVVSQRLFEFFSKLISTWLHLLKRSPKTGKIKLRSPQRTGSSK